MDIHLRKFSYYYNLRAAIIESYVSTDLSDEPLII